MKVALVGASNCVRKDGFGAFLSKRREVISRLSLHSLGATTSVHGMHEIYANRLWEEHDAIVFEYSLNDVASHVLYKPNLLEAVLLRLVAHESIRSRMFFVLLSTCKLLSNVRESRAPLFNTYRRIIREFGCAALDATPFLAGALATQGEEAVYVGNAHLAPGMADQLARRTATALMAMPTPKDTPSPDIMARAPILVRFEPSMASGEIRPAQIATSLVRRKLVEMRGGSRLVLKLPAGRIVGIYGARLPASGAISITIGSRAIIKNLFGPKNAVIAQHYTLFQFAQPIHVLRAADVTIELGVRPPYREGSRHDPTRGEEVCPLPTSQQIFQLEGVLMI